MSEYYYSYISHVVWCDAKPCDQNVLVSYTVYLAILLFQCFIQLGLGLVSVLFVCSFCKCQILINARGTLII